MNELDNVDPNTLTQPEAASLFRSKVAEHQRNTGDELNKAWATVRTLNPKLFAKIAPHAQAQELADVEPVLRCSDSTGIIPGPARSLSYTPNRGSPAPSLASKLMPRPPVSLPNASSILALGLPADASYEEFRAADVANAGAAPRASEVIFEALVALQVGKGLSVDAARDAARARYPFLAAEADAALNADGAPQEASRKAHLASSLAAGGPEQHLSASAAHDKAAQAQDKVGDPDTAHIDRYMATFHRRQSKRLQPA